MESLPNFPEVQIDYFQFLYGAGKVVAEDTGQYICDMNVFSDDERGGMSVQQSIRIEKDHPSVEVRECELLRGMVEWRKEIIVVKGEQLEQYIETQDKYRVIV